MSLFNKVNLFYETVMTTSTSLMVSKSKFNSIFYFNIDGV